MDNLEFRKFITAYGVSYDEYKNMEHEQKLELTNKFKENEKEIKRSEKADNLQSVGKGLQGLGCLIILLPILIAFLYFIFSMIF